MNHIVQQLVMDRRVDLRVDYKKRENLPDEVRPKNMNNGFVIQNFSHTGGATDSIFNLGNEAKSVAANISSTRPDLSDFDTLCSKRRRFQ